MTSSMMRMTANGAAAPNWGSWHVTEAGIVVAAVGIAALLAAWPRIATRQKCLLSLALLTTVLLLWSDVQALSMSSYPSHMVEHLIVVLVIAPLIAGGTTTRVSRPMSTIGFFAFTLLVPLFHLTPLGGWVMRYPQGHYVELIAFLVVGVWFWMPVYGGGRTLGDKQRITYTVLALPVIATTGLVLWSATASSLQSVGMDMSNITIVDVHDGGLVMMVLGTILMVAHVLVLCVRAARRQRTLRIPVGLKYA
ncbi:MAG: cytochrome c oxidase assembly protein [Acidimicrobiales bacterium]